MANRATTTYDGKTICTEDKDGNFSVIYDNRTLTILGAGDSKTLKCAGKVMSTDVSVGNKTLKCSGKYMTTDVVVSVVSLFPSTPSSYNLIATYSANQTWTAPEDGWFQIEVFGASGHGGTFNTKSNVLKYFTTVYSGGGGGGGGYSCSRVALKKGDTVVLTVGSVGATTSAKVNSSHNNSYDHTLQVTSGGNGGSVTSGGGPGGAGGVASGGNHANANGGPGGDGIEGAEYAYMGDSIGVTPVYPNGGTGGVGANGAPNGGRGGGHPGTEGGTYYDRGSGTGGYFKIYRGNTN